MGWREEEANQEASTNNYSVSGGRSRDSGRRGAPHIRSFIPNGVHDGANGKLPDGGIRYGIPSGIPSGILMCHMSNAVFLDLGLRSAQRSKQLTARAPR